MFDDIRMLAHIAVGIVQQRLQVEAHEQGEDYKPKYRGISLATIETAFSAARKKYHSDTSLTDYQPTENDVEKDPFKRLLSSEARKLLGGKKANDANVRILRHIL